MPVENPGGGADPHLTGFDGRGFDFDGRAYGRYRLFEHGDVRIDCLLTPGPENVGTVFGVLYFTIGGVSVQVDTDGHGRLTSPDYDVNWHSLGCSLPSHCAELSNPEDPMNGVAYLNYRIARFPPERPGEAGLIVDGDAEGLDPERYAVEG